MIAPYTHIMHLITLIPYPLPPTLISLSVTPTPQRQFSHSCLFAFFCDSEFNCSCLWNHGLGTSHWNLVGSPWIHSWSYLSLCQDTEQSRNQQEGQAPCEFFHYSWLPEDRTNLLQSQHRYNWLWFLYKTSHMLPFFSNWLFEWRPCSVAQTNMSPVKSSCH